MDKKIIIGISAGVTVLVIAVIAFLGISVSGKTKEAEAAASGFVSLLREGELEELRIEHYVYSSANNIVYRDENGVVKGQTLSKQQVAEIYGVEAVSGISEEAEDMQDSEEEITEENILKVIMKHAQVAADVGTVWSENTKLDLQMALPDLKTWILALSDDELRELNSVESNQEFLAEIEERIASGEIALQYNRLSIPMVKQNNKWRFRVTEEMEQSFFGGLYNLFDQEETTTAE